MPHHPPRPPAVAALLKCAVFPVLRNSLIHDSGTFKVIFLGVCVVWWIFETS